MKSIDRSLSCIKCRNQISFGTKNIESDKDNFKTKNSKGHNHQFDFKKEIMLPILSAISLVILMYIGAKIAEALMPRETYLDVSYDNILGENIGSSSLLVATIVLAFCQSLIFITSIFKNRLVSFINTILVKICELLLAYLLCMSVFILFSWENVNVMYVLWSVLLVLISPTYSYVRNRNRNSKIDTFMCGLVNILFLVGIIAFTVFHLNFSCQSKFFCTWVG
ncbi:hypothetical protein V4T70_004153 [Vibrio vulnificus]|nr:hypothetical protein [Vibrio vulnificus]